MKKPNFRLDNVKVESERSEPEILSEIIQGTSLKSTCPDDCEWDASILCSCEDYCGSHCNCVETCYSDDSCYSNCNCVTYGK